MDEYISKSYLITKFNELADKYAGNEHKRQRALAYATAADMIKLMDAADVQPVKRISVNDRLPDKSCECLGIVDGEVTEVNYVPKQKGLICVWSMCDANGFKPLPDDAVTHWMLMPEPPQD